MSEFPPKFKATRDLERDNEKLEAKVFRLKEEGRRLKRKIRKLKRQIAAQSTDAVGSEEVDTRLFVNEPEIGKRR